MTDQNTSSGAAPAPVPTAEQNTAAAAAPPRAPALATRPEDYRPVSMSAVAGLLIGGGVAALVLVSMMMSVSSGDPVILPVWFVVMTALGGAAVSFIALRQITASEGTRSGMGLARWGIWLNIVIGTGYFVFFQSTQFALQYQADTFLMYKSDDDKDKQVPDTGFIPRLLEGCQPAEELAARKAAEVQFNCAFLLTVPDRGGNNPKDSDAMSKTFDTKDAKGGPSRLGQFRENGMVRFLRDSLIYVPDKDMVKIEPAGVHSCQYTPPKGKGRGSWTVVRNYRVVTPEIVRVFSLDVRSIEASGPGERRKWYLALPNEQLHDGYRTPLGQGLRDLRISAYKFLAEWNKSQARKLREKDMTNYDQLLPTPEFRTHVKSRLADIDLNGGKVEIPSMANVEITPWRIVDGKVQIDYPVNVTMPGLALDQTLRLDGYVTVESTEPVDPAALNSGSPSPQWTIQFVRWLQPSQLELKAPPRKK